MQTKNLELKKDLTPVVMETHFSTFTISFGVVGCIGAITLWMNDFNMEALWLAVSSFLVSFTSKETKIDLLKKEISRNIKVVGIPFRIALEKYSQADSLQIKKSRMRQQMHSRGNSTTITFFLYKGYLITEGKTHLLTKSKNREYVVKRMEKVSQELGIPLMVD